MNIALTLTLLKQIIPLQMNIADDVKYLMTSWWEDDPINPYPTDYDSTLILYHWICTTTKSMLVLSRMALALYGKRAQPFFNKGHIVSILWLGGQ